MSVFKTVKGFIPVYPIVFNILYVLSIYQVNANVVPFKCTAVPFFNGMISTAFCIVIAAIVLRSIYAATWLSALLSIAAFIFPFVGVNLSESWSIVLFPVIIFSIVATTIVLRLKQLAWLINITRFMNLLAFCSLGCSLVLTVFCYYDDDRQVAGPDANFTEMFQSELPLESKNVKDPLESPDIVFVVVDGYARQDVLEDMYNYENSEFMHFLHKKHFFVADKSCANYCQTVLSMASAFNGSYFEADSNHISRLSRSLADQSFNHSRVSQFLKENGYKIALTYSGYNNVCTIQGVSAEAPSWVRDFNSINFENAVKSRLTLGVPHQYRDLIGRLYMTPSLCYYALTHAEWSHSRRIIDSVREMTEYPLINTPPADFSFFPHCFSSSAFCVFYIRSFFGSNRLLQRCGSLDLQYGIQFRDVSESV